MNNLPKIVIFDWDGTIVNTKQCIVQSINHVLKSYNLPLWEELKSLKVIDRNKAFKSNIEAIFENRFDEAFILYKLTYLNFFKELVKTYEYSNEVISFLKSKNVKIHIISNKDSFLLKEEIKFFFGENFFDNILGYDDCIEQKPSSIVVDRSLSGYENLDRTKDVIFIGDAEVDIMCAINSKCVPILIFAHDFPFQHHTKCVCVSSFKELHKHFLSLNYGINANEKDVSII